MRIRWSPEAAEDLVRIGLHIRQDNPAAARRVVKAIHNAVSELKTFPERGRTGRVEGSRELVISSLPYIAVYRVIGQTVEVSRIYPARRIGHKRAPMANPEHLEILKQGVAVWNEWREANPLVRPDLSDAKLQRADLTYANFNNART